MITRSEVWGVLLWARVAPGPVGIQSLQHRPGTTGQENCAVCRDTEAVVAPLGYEEDMKAAAEAYLVSLWEHSVLVSSQ